MRRQHGSVDTQLLEVFRTVARLGSITAAARVLSFTQSAVSRQVAALEAETGGRLFDRLARGVELTAEGRSLLPHADAVLDRLADAHRDLDELRGLGAGRLRVGAFPTALAALVPRALAAFRVDHPGVASSLVEGVTPVLLDRLVAGGADLAVVTEGAGRPLDQGRFDLHHLLDERLLVAVPAGHRLADRRGVRLADLADEAFVAGSSAVEDTLIRAAAGFRPRIDVVATGWTAKLGCVAAGLGVTLVPLLAATDVRPDVVLLELAAGEASTRRVAAATSVGRARSPAVTAFLDELDRVAGAFRRAVSPTARGSGSGPVPGRR